MKLHKRLNNLKLSNSVVFFECHRSNYIPPPSGSLRTVTLNFLSCIQYPGLNCSVQSMVNGSLGAPVERDVAYSTLVQGIYNTNQLEPRTHTDFRVGADFSPTNFWEWACMDREKFRWVYNARLMRNCFSSGCLKMFYSRKSNESSLEKNQLFSNLK